MAVKRDLRIWIAWIAYAIFLMAVADRCLFFANGWSPARAVLGSMFVFMHVGGLVALGVSVYFLPGQSWGQVKKWAALLGAPLVVVLIAYPQLSVIHATTLAEQACVWAQRRPELGGNIKVAVVVSNWKDEHILVEGSLRSALVRVNLYDLGEEVAQLYPSNAQMENHRSTSVSWFQCN